MVKERTTLVNQLRETLSILYPELDRILIKLDSPTYLALLVTYPGPEHIARAGERRVAETLSIASKGKIGLPLAKILVETAKNTVGVSQKQQALAIKVSILSQRLTDLTMAIEGVEEEITKLFKRLPYDPKDFPVGNITSLATIISEIEDIRRFPSLKQFLSHFGWCPQSFQTGSYKRKHPRV